MLPVNLRRNQVRSFASEAEANRTFYAYMAVTALFGAAVILLLGFTLNGNIHPLVGAVATIACGLIAYVAGGIQHDAWLRVTPAETVREEGFIPLDLEGNPR